MKHKWDTFNRTFTAVKVTASRGGALCKYKLRQYLVAIHSSSLEMEVNELNWMSRGLIRPDL